MATAKPAKPTKAKKSPAKAAPEASAASDVLRKKDLFDQVVTRTALKKRDVKPAVEAALALIADSLQAGKEVNLPPLGKIRVVKTKEGNGGATVATLKLRSPRNASAPGNSGVAEDGGAD